MSIFCRDLKSSFNKAAKVFEQPIYASALKRKTNRLCKTFEKYMHSNAYEDSKKDTVMKMVSVLNLLGRGSQTRSKLKNDFTVKKDIEAIEKVTQSILENTDGLLLPTRGYIDSRISRAIGNTVLSTIRSLGYFMRNDLQDTTSVKDYPLVKISEKTRDAKIATLKKSEYKLNNKRIEAGFL